MSSSSTALGGGNGGSSSSSPSHVVATTFHYASFDRQEEWEQCCAMALGYDYVELFDLHHQHVDDVDDYDDDDHDDNADDHNNDNKSPVIIQQIINLVDNDVDDHDDDLEDEEDSNQRRPTNPWMTNATRIQAAIQNMAVWIHSKKYEYVSVDMSEEEANLITSTVTTFLASTATDLETLRGMIVDATTTSSSSSIGINHNNNNNSGNLASHYAGIVQILLEELKFQLAEPFKLLQKQRQRAALHIWQHPLQVKLYQPKPKKASRAKTTTTDTSFLFDDLDNDDEEEEEEVIDQRFLPKRGRPAAEDDDDDDYEFMVDMYMNPTSIRNKASPPRRPQFVIDMFEKKQQMNKKRRVDGEHEDDGNVHTATTAGTTITMADAGGSGGGAVRFQPKQQQQQPTRMPYQQNPNPQEDEQQEHDVQNELLQREAQLLQLQVNSDLESVQKVERTMVEITTMISQFANLVEEQQENIQSIHDTAQVTKENLQKGKDKLVDATTKTKQSKHYMAKAIFAMTCVLLFFHLLKN